MNHSTKDTLLKISLVLFGAIFFLIYPLSIVWPSGWQWHGGDGAYYFQMICGVYATLGFFLIKAAWEPQANKSLIDFTVWSSVVHALIMAVQAFGDEHETGHLIGDVPALLLVAGALWYLAPEPSAEIA